MRPVGNALLKTSSLVLRVKDGLAALDSQHTGLIERSIRDQFADSLDLDAALEAEHPSDPRWDYLVGHSTSRSILGLEPHSARDAEITTAIAKRTHAILQLRPHLRPGTHVDCWFWVASGRVDFLSIEKARLRLSQEGIAFVGRELRVGDIPGRRPGSNRKR
jgi:hypothetical protein